MPRKPLNNEFLKRPGQPPPCVPPHVRIYAIGDIHGRVDLLNSLLTRIDADLARSPIEHPVHVFLGDYIDRGPASSAVIEQLIDRKLTHETVCLKGNHEVMLLDFLKNPDAFVNWRRWGGSETLMSYRLAPSGLIGTKQRKQLAEALQQAMPQSHRDFFSSLLVKYVCGGYFFVHAGVRPGIDLSAQVEDDLLWIREDFLFADDNFGKIIVHGHEPVQTPVLRTNRIGIDTGAYISGNLTCLVIEGNNLWLL